MIARLREEAAIFAVALQFLTRLPVPAGAYAPSRMPKATGYFPLAGAVVGMIGATVLTAAGWLLPHQIAVLISMAATLLLTGCFHEDGLADTFDGIGGGATRERALEIMKDSRIGAYGAAALLMALMLKAAALSAMSLTEAMAALVAGHVVSRASAVAAVAASRYVRDNGTAKPVAEGVSGARLALALATAAAALLLVGAALSWRTAGLALTGAAAGHIAMRLFYERKLGGYTGDCLGAVQQASELGLYLGVLSWR